MRSTVASRDNKSSMSEVEVPAGPPAWPGGAQSNDPWVETGWAPSPPTPGWWPQHYYYSYEPPPPPRRTSRLRVLIVALVLFIFGASAAATAAIATRGIGGSGSTTGVKAAIVDIVTTLPDGAAAAGTGIVIMSSGVVMTNDHVITTGRSISVRLTATGDTFPASVIKEDVNHDVAVLQLEGASGLATAPIGDSSKVQVGDNVTALGNAQGRGGTPATAAGIVTALGQTINAADQTGANAETLVGMIETNAPIQPGDSGGPLVNASGRVIGMDTAASTGGRDQQTGAVQAFAIPINTALNYAHQLLANPNSQTPPAGGFLGVCAHDSTSPPGAVLSADPACGAAVQAGTPAANAGLSSGDVIISVDGAAVDSRAALQTILQGDRAGQPVVVEWDDPSGVRHQATVTLAAPPATP